MSACPELNGWTFMNYPQEEAEALLAAMANQHKMDKSNVNDDGDFCEVNSEDEVIDYVGQAANLLQEGGNIKSSLFSTFNILYAEHKQEELDISVLRGTLNKIVLDTGCIRTVAGKVWMNHLLASMNDETQKLIQTNVSNNSLKFGVGSAQKSLGEYVVPIKLGTKNFMLTTDVIETDIPCLLSKTAMIKSSMIINMANNSIDMFGQKFDMVNVPSGHSAVVIEPYNLSKADEFYSFVTLEENTEYDLKKIKHIHEQLGHPGRHTMEIMLRNAGFLNMNMKTTLNKLYETCATCFIHKKAKTKPKVSAPMSQNFNETICMDLKVWPKHGVIILYIIDTFSRFTAAFIIPNKKPESILKPFLDSWILTRFGAPRSILVDNGGEFVNKKMTDLCQNFNIRIFTTAGYSPFQNGICERNHATVDEIIDKMMTSGKYKSVREALNAAIFAKNIRTSTLGFSPFQIVFGSNPRIPGAIENEPPAESGMTITSLVQKRLQSIFDARKAMAEVENKSRLKAAEKSSHVAKFQAYNIGDEVYFRMGNSSKWSGPGKIVAQDNKLIFIRHGRHLIVASQSRVQLANQNNGVDINKYSLQINSTGLPGHYNEEITSQNQETSDSESENLNEEEHEMHYETETQQIEEVFFFFFEEVVTESNGNDFQDFTPTPESNINTKSNSNVTWKSKKKGKIIKSYERSQPRLYPKTGNYVFLKPKDEKINRWDRVKIWQCVTKGKQSPSGPYFNWIYEDGRKSGGYIDNFEWHIEGNINQNEDDIKNDIKSYIAYDHDELSSKDNESDQEFPNITLVTFLPKDEYDSLKAIKAKELELRHFQSYGVYKEVDDVGQPRVSSSWVLTKKIINGQDDVKARLVCHGNQQSIWYEELNPKTDSPTVKRKSIKILIAMAAQFGWSVKSQDVTAAFLQAKDLVREIHVQPPKDLKTEGKIWRLIKPMYGLDEASFLWYETLKEFLLGLGCEQLINDPAVFYYRTTQLEGM